MPNIAIPSGLELEYETFGDANDPAVLLVSGFTAQLTSWDEGLCAMLADGGRYVIRFDNRDIGLSSKLDGQSVDVQAILAAVAAGEPVSGVPYTLSDMAADGIGLLDALGIDKAHVVGASMGGMIVQMLAIEHADRVLSATSIMSTTGDQAYGQSSPEAIAVLLSPPPATLDDVLARADQLAVWSSKRHFNTEYVRARLAKAWERSNYTAGIPRQLAAIHATGDRSARLADVKVPFLVIHGLDDTLIDASGGRRTAELVEASHLLLLADMGHDLPMPLWPIITGTIIGHQQMAMESAS